MTKLVSLPTAPDLAQLDRVESPVFVLEPGHDGLPRYVAFNAHARGISGRPLSDYLGHTAAEVYAAAFGRTALARHREVMRTGQGITYELELPIGDATRLIRTTLVPEKGPDGRVCRIYGTSRDLTDEQRTREARVCYDTAATEMEEFIALAAHDLRAPLRNVSLIAEMLRDGFVDHGDGKLDLIDVLEEISTKTARLIADVLSYATALEAQQVAQAFNFRALCQDIRDVLDPRSAHDFTFTRAEISGDRTAFQIAIRNIIDNAIKHGGTQHLKIEVSVAPDTAHPGMLAVTLRDDGKGFSDGALDFAKGGGFGTDSGYGLLGVRRMVEARGGRLSARTDPGGGAVIAFALPGTWLGATESLGDRPGDTAGARPA